MPVPDPVLRAAGPDDDDAIRECIAAAFPHNPKAAADIYDWQYRANPFGETISWVWDDGDRIAAHYGAFAMPALLDGRPGLVANAVDAAVHPDHQGRGLFSPLARALYDDCAAHGMPVALCFATNDIALRGVAKAGWVEVAQLRALVTAFDGDWLAQRFHLPRPLARAARAGAFRLGSGPVATQVIGPPEGLDELWHTVAAPVRWGMVRDAAWWNWRYGEAPIGYGFLEVRDRDRLLGAAVVREQERFGGRFAYVLELLAVDSSAARALLRGVRQALPHVVGAVTLVVEGSVQASIARQAGLRPLPRRLEPHPARFGTVDIDGSHPGAASGQWHLGWGDLDHV